MDSKLLQERINNLLKQEQEKLISNALYKAHILLDREMYRAMEIMAVEPQEDWNMCLNLEGLSSSLIGVVKSRLELSLC